MKPFVLPPPEKIAQVRAMAERRLSAEEFDAYVNAPVGDFEREEATALFAWFKRRYPTPLERFAWGRRAWRDCKRRMPP